MVAKLLKEKFVNLNLKSRSKKQALAELAEFISRSGKLKSKKLFLKCLIEREKLGSTGIGNGVAIPHAKTKAAGGFILGFARSDAGIDFGALDGEKTFLFFVLASPQADVGGHLKILAEISRLVKDKFIVYLLKKAKTKKEILNIISRA